MIQGSSEKVKTPTDPVVAPTLCAMMIWVATPPPEDKYMAVDGSPLDSSLTNKYYEQLQPLSCKRFRNIKDSYVFFYFPEEVIL